MTDPQKPSTSKRPTGQMSVVAKLSGRSRDDLYRLFRREEAPSPVTHVSGVPVYDLDECMAWLHPVGEDQADPLERGTVLRIAPGAPPAV